MGDRMGDRRGMNSRTRVSCSLGWAGESGASAGHSFNSHRFPMCFFQLGGAQKPPCLEVACWAVPQFHVRNEEGLASLCCNSVRKLSYLLEVEVLDQILSSHWITSVILLEINGNFDVDLSGAKISLHVHKADVKIRYISNWGLPSLWVAGLAASPFSISPPNGQPGLPCTCCMAEPGASRLGAVKGCCYVELVPCSPSYCSTIPEWHGTKPT